TAWILNAFSSQELTTQIKNTLSFLRNNIVNEIEDDFELSNFVHIRKLYGLLMVLPVIFKEQLWKKKSLFLQNLKLILDYVEKKSWINSQIAAYCSFFLRDINALSCYAKKAENFLDSYKIEKNDPFAALGSTIYLHKLCESENFLTSIDRMPDEEVAHLLVALSGNKGNTNEQVIGRVKEQLIKLIQRRHLTELDKRVTKELLDSLLLIRAKVSEKEALNRLNRLGSSVYMKEIDSTKSSIKFTTEIPSSGLSEVLGRIDLIVLSAYVYAINQLGEKIVYIVPQKEYKMIEKFFSTSTYPVFSKRIFFYELILSVPIISIGLYLIFKLENILSIQFSSYDHNTRLILTLVSYSGSFLLCIYILSRILRRVFPISSSIIGSKIPKSVSSSRIWKKIWGD
ncbi:MAG: hypothetical protein ACTSQY_09615, partial [Candidatus Odinarchaeia archaeon]